MVAWLGQRSLPSSLACFCSLLASAMSGTAPVLLQVLYFSESLVPTARKALCDPLEEVREAAAKTFEQLHSTIGHQALEDILPFLLKQLVSGSAIHLPVWFYCLYRSETQGVYYAMAAAVWAPGRWVQ